MALPFVYTNTLISPQPVSAYPDKSGADLAKALTRKFPREKLHQSVIQDDSVEFSSTLSLFNIKYDVSVQFFVENNYWKAKYTLQLNNVILVTLGALLAAGLFSKFTLNHFIWFSIIFTLIFYTINVWFIVAAVKNRIYQLAVFTGFDFDTAEKMSEEQQEWLQNKEQCPACGAHITEYHVHCPACGLKLPGPRKTSPYNVSRINVRQINYNYREKDDKENKDNPDAT